MSKRFQVDPNETITIYEFEPGDRGDEQPNRVVIRARMDVATQDKVRGGAARVVVGPNGQPQQSEELGEYLTNLLVYNVISWAGPDFDDIPCNAETIRRLPGNDAFIERVRNIIAARNQAKPSPVKNSRAGSGFSSGGKADSSRPEPAGSIAHRLATTTARSTSHSDSDGRRDRSAN